jgi:hypothetical protein
MVDGKEQGRWDFDSTSGTVHSHTFEPAPAEPPQVAVTPAPAPVVSTLPFTQKPAPHSHLAQWITIGTGAALLAGGAVIGYLALDKMHDIEKKCPSDRCPDGSYKSDVNSARTLGTTTDALLIAGGAVAVGGLVWLILDKPSKREHAAQKSTKLSGACAPGTCSLVLGGAF